MTTMASATATAAAAVGSSDTSAIAPAANERQRRQREELAELEEGGGASEGEKGTPEEAGVINSATDRTTGTGVPVGTARTETTFEEDVEASSTPRVANEEVVVATATVRATAATGSAKAGEIVPEGGRWPATLDARWAEVEFMLCHEVESEESLQHTIEATKAGLVFMDKLEKKAQVYMRPLRRIIRKGGPLLDNLRRCHNNRTASRYLVLHTYIVLCNICGWEKAARRFFT